MEEIRAAVVPMVKVYTAISEASATIAYENASTGPATGISIIISPGRETTIAAKLPTIAPAR